MTDEYHENAPPEIFQHETQDAQLCPRCNVEMVPFTYSRDDSGDYEYALGCPNCGRREY